MIDDDVEKAADALRPMIALYVGGMGAREMNFHYDVFCRLGYEAEAAKIQELYLAGRKEEAAAAVPDALVDEVALCGPRERIAERLAPWRKIPGLILSVGTGDPDTLRTLAELAL